MPSESHSARPQHGDQAGAGQQGVVSRRSMLRGAAGAGAATLAASTLLGSAGQALAAARPAAAEPEGPAPDVKNVIVHVRDARSGEIDIFSGTRQTRLTDKALAARLARAAG